MDNKYKNSLTVKSVLDIYNNVTSKENTLKLDPKYQRGSVWNLEDKSAFIDSLYRNIVPNNIILNYNSNGTSECIDGKQRITSIIEFKENKFPLIFYNNLDNTNEEEHVYFSNIPEINDPKKKKQRKIIKYRTFTQEEKNKFNNINIPVITYYQLDYCDRVDIFSRIQKGKNLTLGENMAACLPSDNICNIFNKYCTELEHFFKEYNNKINIERSDHRVIIAHIFYIIEYNQFGTKTKVTNCLKRIKENNSKEFTRKMDKIGKILGICFNDKILKHPELVGLDLSIDLMYIIFMCIQKNFSENIISVSTILVEATKCIHKKYYKSKKPKIGELYREFNTVFTEIIDKLKPIKNDEDDSYDERENDEDDE